MTRESRGGLLQPAAPPHPTPTISVSSAPDDESAGSGSPDEPRSVAHSEDPPSVFASGDVTPTDRTDPVLVTCSDDEQPSACALTREPSKDSPASSISCKIGELPGAAEEPPRPPVAPLAVCEDIGVDDENVDKVPSAPLQRVSVPEAASQSDATKIIAHEDELSSVSDSNIVKRDNKSVIGERKQRNDICPWEDE